MGGAGISKNSGEKGDMVEEGEKLSSIWRRERRDRGIWIDIYAISETLTYSVNEKSARQYRTLCHERSIFFSVLSLLLSLCTLSSLTTPISWKSHSRSPTYLLSVIDFHRSDATDLARSRRDMRK